MRSSCPAVDQTKDDHRAIWRSAVDIVFIHHRSWTDSQFASSGRLEAIFRSEGSPRHKPIRREVGCAAREASYGPAGPPCDNSRERQPPRRPRFSLPLKYRKHPCKQLGGRWMECYPRNHFDKSGQIRGTIHHRTNLYKNPPDGAAIEITVDLNPFGFGGCKRARQTALTVPERLRLVVASHVIA